MEVSWREGIVWIVSETYEGPADLMNFFIERGKLPPHEVAAHPLLEALLPLLERLPLEERMEVLLFLAHLLWLKAKALLPTFPSQEAPSAEATPPSAPENPLSPTLLQTWEAIIQQNQYRLSRPPTNDITPLPLLKPITQMDLLRTYLALQAAYENRQRRYQVQLPALSLENVAQDLQTYFSQTPQTTLSALFSSLPPNALYWAMAFFVILSWIQEERLHYKPITLWEGHLTWVDQPR
jgi:chromatin segregation and condensation protein Rec8/ScpA/Scc1 (kleisin family)